MRMHPNVVVLHTRSDHGQRNATACQNHLDRTLAIPCLFSIHSLVPIGRCVGEGLTCSMIKSFSALLICSSRACHNDRW
jgi:hypothetical protein